MQLLQGTPRSHLIFLRRQSVHDLRLIISNFTCNQRLQAAYTAGRRRRLIGSDILLVRTNTELYKTGKFFCIWFDLIWFFEVENHEKIIRRLESRAALMVTMHRLSPSYRRLPLLNLRACLRVYVWRRERAAYEQFVIDIFLLWGIKIRNTKFISDNVWYIINREFYAFNWLSKKDNLWTWRVALNVQSNR